MVTCESWAELLELDGMECRMTVTADIAERKRPTASVRLRYRLDALDTADFHDNGAGFGMAHAAKLSARFSARTRRTPW